MNPPVGLIVNCPVCGGAGEIGTHQNYWGIWETTATCTVCAGTGEVYEAELEVIADASLEDAL